MEKTPTHRSSRTAAMLMAAAAVMPLAYQGVSAESLVQREIAKRALRVQEADAAILEGRKAYTEKNYQKAVDEYRKALNSLPSGPAVADRRHAFTGHFVDGAIALTQQYRRTGRYAEARSLLEDVLQKDPNNVAVKQQLEYLDDPIRTNPVLTYKHTQNVEKVRKLLYRAEGYYNLGQYDRAESEYKEILRIDRYNKAARRGMEKIASVKSDYYRAAYDHTRAEMLRQVDQAWEIVVPPSNSFNGPGDSPTDTELSGALYLKRKLQNIEIPIVDFENVTVEEAVDFLRQRSRELDDTELDESKKGVNFVVRTPKVVGGANPAAGGAFGGGANIGAARIDNLQIRNVPLEVVLDQICKKADLRYRVEDYAVVLLPANDVDDAELFTRRFTVPPDFLTLIDDGSAGGGGASDDPFADDGGGGGSNLRARPPVRDLLEKSGIVFPEGATATFSKARSVLTVRNTATNIDLVEQLVDSIKKDKPKQIKMLTKFVEISQENTDELGFDWVISPFGLDANTLFLGGGSIGSGVGRTGANFNSPVNGFNVPGIGASNTGVSNIATGGLRSGDFAINRDSIDSFLNNPNRTSQNSSVAPGILSLTGLFSDGQVQMIMRGLAQKKGADVMTAPSIVSRSGEKATIEIIREFIYPTEYEPPELPNSVGTSQGLNGANGGLTGGSTFPVTPATPTAFETRNTGVTLEVEPTLGDDGYTIDLRFAPEIVEFEGFINYGSPIQTTASDALGNPVTITITENRIEMPVFSTRRVNTGLTIYDGHTVAVGGLMREDVQNVEDKVPILGDLPLVGRLFQSKSENHIKSNLIVFVTAQIIDATGQPVRSPRGSLVNGPGTSGVNDLPTTGGGLLPVK